jgi:hypothetical protein
MLPRRWRNALPFASAIQWTRAATLSGLLESVLAIVAMGYWYSCSVMVWIDHAAGETAQGKMGPTFSSEALGFTAYAVMLAHPMTWFIAYFVVEGVVRLCSAAFSGGVFGLLSLAIVDATLQKITGAPGDSLRPPELKPTFSSVSAAVKDHILTATVPAGADELNFLKSGEQEILEIRGSRKKDGWDPPRVVRFDDKYYRLVELKRGAPPRPFVYVLHRLAAGVPGRNVLLYSSQDAVVAGKR